MPNYVTTYDRFKITLHKGWIGGWSWCVEDHWHTWRGASYETEAEALSAAMSLIDSVMNPVEESEE